MADDSESSELAEKYDDLEELRDDEDTPEPKPLSEYDTYQDFLENEVMEDELIVGSAERTWGEILLKLGFYFVLILLFLSVLALLGYVIIEVLIYLAEYAGDNITVDNTSVSNTTASLLLLLNYSTEYL